MKKKNIITIISLVIVFAALITVFTGCSLGHFAFNFKQRIFHGMNFNEKRNLPEEFNFKDRQRNPENNYFKNKHMFKQNVENIPFVGIEMSQTTKDVKSVLVNSVIAGSPAEKAGIKPQDIITAFDGKAVNSPYELQSQVLSHKVGDNVKLTISRNGQSLELNLTLTGLPNNMKNIEKDKQNSLQNPEQENKQTY
jgi:predicted metalloprotease with PDZ domain